MVGGPLYLLSAIMSNKRKDMFAIYEGKVYRWVRNNNDIKPHEYRIMADGRMIIWGNDYYCEPFIGIWELVE